MNYKTPLSTSSGAKKVEIGSFDEKRLACPGYTGYIKNCLGFLSINHIICLCCQVYYFAISNLLNLKIQLINEEKKKTHIYLILRK